MQNELPEKPPFQIVEYTNSKTYNIYLSQDIVSAEKYDRLFDLIRSAGQYDVIKIYINSPGGNMFTGIQLINSIKESSAYVITVLDGTAMSLAPLIVLAGDEIIINEHSIMMFHDFSTESGGKGSELVSSAAALAKFYKNMLESYAYPFLTKKEISKVTSGQDLYFDTEEITKRMERVVKHKEKELEMAENNE